MPSLKLSTCFFNPEPNRSNNSLRQVQPFMVLSLVLDDEQDITLFIACNSIVGCEEEELFTYIFQQLPFGKAGDIFSVVAPKSKK